MNLFSRTSWLGTGAAVASSLSKRVINRLPSGSGEVYLTFDDGPSDGTAMLSEYLAEYQIPSTYFVTGERLEAHVSTLERTADSIHLANHFYTHDDPWRLAPGEVVESIERTQELLASLNTPVAPFVRPPYGHITRHQLRHCREQRLKTILWDVMPADFDSQTTVSKVAGAVLNHVRDGSIIVLHDTGEDHISKTILPAVDVLRSELSNRHLKFGSLPDRLRA